MDNLPLRLVKSIANTASFLAVLGFANLASGEVDDAVADAFGQATYQSSGGLSLPYRLLEPPGSGGKEADERRYSLVLFFHGAGERGDDNRVQLVHAAADFAREDRRKKFPAFVVFPQCPKEQRWVESDWDLPSGRGAFADEPSQPMRAALELVDELIKTKPIDKSRVFVTGLSMGGMGTWYAAAAKPRRFAAMLEVCGGGDPDWAGRYAGMPIWAFHGQADRVVPISRGREMVTALTQSGHHPELRFVEYPGVGHDSWTRTYSRDDVYEWLFAQRKTE